MAYEFSALLKGTPTSLAAFQFYLQLGDQRPLAQTWGPAGSRWPGTHRQLRPAQRRWAPWCRWSSRQTAPSAGRRQSARRRCYIGGSSWTWRQWRRTKKPCEEKRRSFTPIFSFRGVPEEADPPGLKFCHFHKILNPLSLFAFPPLLLWHFIRTNRLLRLT